MSDLGKCSIDWSLFVFQPQIPADKLTAALENPGAIRLAYDLGVLEFIALSLTVLGVVIALFALLGAWLVRREAVAVVRETAEAAIPAEVEGYMDRKGKDLLRACLKEPELVSTMQATLARLGIRGADDAAEVDTDAGERENAGEGHSGPD